MSGTAATYTATAVARSIGWTEVPVTVVEGFTGAANLLVLERDENTSRKDFAPEETASLGRSRKPMFEAENAERLAERGKQAGRSRPLYGLIKGVTPASE